MVKILQLCAVDYTAYHLMRPLGRGLREAGYDVTFCCSPGEWLDRLRDEGFTIAALPISRNYNIISHLISFIRLVRLMRREHYDLVHAHTPVAGLIGRAAARAAGVPRVVYTAHGFYFHEGMSGPVRRLFVGLERFGGRLSDLVFVQSGEDRREAVREGVAPPEKLIHIGNGVDPTMFGRDIHAVRIRPLREELGIGPGPVVGFLGRLVREKGAVDFARAAALVKRSFPDAKFVIAGEPLATDRDGCREEVRAIQEDAGLGADLVLAGFRSDVPELMSLFDLFVLPSYREGMPRTLLEAMATGLPVVATDIRGSREEVVDGETGILCPVGDPRALAVAIEKILGDPQLAASMGARGRERVLEHFDERTIVSLQVERIGHLLGKQ
jgi:glycosyltransferase involved in cell wall biosynthesis